MLFFVSLLIRKSFFDEILPISISGIASAVSLIGNIFFGKVAFAGWIDGYGQTIIIDHGDHYYSLYAHNSLLQKKTGDEVAGGETIAQSGDTASLHGPGLYMEIRHFSESLDPLPWLDLSKVTRL